MKGFCIWSPAAPPFPVLFEHCPDTPLYYAGISDMRSLAWAFLMISLLTGEDVNGWATLRQILAVCLEPMRYIAA